MLNGWISQETVVKQYGTLQIGYVYGILLINWKFNGEDVCIIFKIADMVKADCW